MAVKKKKALLLDDYHLLSYEELDSTNEEAKRLADGGAAHGAFIWSLRQHAGKGRQNKYWVSNEGNLFTSVLLSPDAPLEKLSQLSFVAANSALDSISPLLDEKFSLHCKWPNDLLINGKKLGGILLESFETIENCNERKRWVVVGLGVNIDNSPSIEGVDTISLKDAGVELVSAKIILSRFIHHFINWYGTWEEDGFESIRDHWLEHCTELGKNISVSLPKETLSGVFHDLDNVGNLQLQLADKSVLQVTAGDVHVL